jgi:hypothetical protein
LMSYFYWRHLNRSFRLSPDDSTLQQSDTDSVQGCCTVNCMKLPSSARLELLLSQGKLNPLIYSYKLSESVITRACSIDDPGAFVNSKLHVHRRVDYTFSQSINLLGLVCTLTFSFSYIQCLLRLYEYFTLVLTKLELTRFTCTY